MNKVSRRQFLQMTGLTAGAALFAACAVPAAPPAAETGGEAAAPSEAKVEMEAWSRMTDVAEESTRAIIDMYNEQNTIGATLTFVYIAQTQGSQADEKLLTAVAGGNPPDVYYADRFTVPQFAHQGFFAPITDLATASGVTADQYWDFAWAEATYKDGIYALPFDTDTRALWINLDIWEEAGLDPAKLPQTIQDLEAATEALTVKNDAGAITRFGFNPLYDQAWLYTWGFDFKGEFQDPATRKITFAHPNNVAAMEWLKGFVDKIGVQDLDAILSACATGACAGERDPFWTGQAVMACSGDWKVAQAKRYKPDTKYAVVPMPGPDGPAPHASWAGGWSWANPMGSPNPEAGFDAISFLCGEVGQDKYNKDTYHIPTLKKVAEDPYFREDPLHAIFMDLLPVSHSRPPIPFGSKLWDLQVKAFRDEIPHGMKTPEQALTDIDTEINKDLEEAGFFS